jgi:inner membrane transporter RhtA
MASASNSSAYQGGIAIAGLSIVAAQISINLGAALGKGLFASIGPEGVAALRTTISALLLLAIARPWRAPPGRQETIWLVLYGLTLGSMNLMFYWAIQRIPIGIGVAIEICGPLAVVLITSRSARDVLWLALAIAGLLLLMPWSGADQRLDSAGMAFALGAALCWALYIVFGKRASQVEGIKAVACGMTIACLVTLPFGLAVAGHRLQETPVLVLGAVVALLSSALPYVLEMKALERLTARIFGVVTSAAPAIAALVGFLILGERLTWAQWLAVVLMISAGAGCSLAGRPTIHDEREAQ